ncbi:MAG: hypothetical protein WCG87_11360, partial [Bacteroidota bacterium]
MAVGEEHQQRRAKNLNYPKVNKMSRYTVVIVFLFLYTHSNAQLLNEFTKATIYVKNYLYGNLASNVKNTQFR